VSCLYCGRENESTICPHCQGALVQLSRQPRNDSASILQAELTAERTRREALTVGAQKLNEENERLTVERDSLRVEVATLKQLLVEPKLKERRWLLVAEVETTGLCKKQILEQIKRDFNRGDGAWINCGTARLVEIRGRKGARR
jgi:hypothetical protein